MFFTQSFKYKQQLLYIADSLLVLLSLYSYNAIIYSASLNLIPHITNNSSWYIVVLCTWIATAWLSGLYVPDNFLSYPKILKKTFWVAFIVALAYLFTPYFTPSLPDSRWKAFLLILIFTSSMSVWRLLFALIFKTPIFRQNALVVGASDIAKIFIKTLYYDSTVLKTRGVKLLGIYDEEEISNEHNKQRAFRVLEHDGGLLTYVRRLKVNELIIATAKHKALRGKLFQQINECIADGIRVVYATDAFEELTGHIMVGKKEDAYYMMSDFNTHSTNRIYWLFTQILNYSTVIIGLLVLCLTLPFVAVGNLISSRGPLFYTQQRVGYRGKLFTIYKFRSMIVNAETGGAQWADKNDSRITPIGNFLRKTRIDELPQFINVLKGEMSLVGPRPERPEFVEKLSKQIPFFSSRSIAKPGLTGWAQVNYKYGNTQEDALKKLQYDLYYIKNKSILLDSKVIFKTMGVVINMKGH